MPSLSVMTGVPWTVTSELDGYDAANDQAGFLLERGEAINLVVSDPPRRRGSLFSERAATRSARPEIAAAPKAPPTLPAPRPSQKIDGVSSSGPTGIRLGRVEKLPRGGVIVYTSAGWVQLGVPMWSNRDTLARFAMQGGFKPPGTEGFVPNELISHTIPTVCIFDLDYTPETTGLFPSDFEQYLFFVARGTRFRFVMPDAQMAQRASDYLNSSYRGPQGVNLKERMRLEHGPGARGIPNLAAEQAVFGKSSPSSICDVESMTAQEYHFGDEVVIRKVAPQLYEIFDHGEMGARVDLTDKAWEIPQPRLTPDLEIHQNREFLRLRHRVLIEGEAGVWPLGTSDGFSLGKTEATAGHIQWNNGKCTLIDPTSDVVERFLTQGIPLETIEGIVITHGHGDHFGDAVAKFLRILPQIKIYTTRTIFDHVSAMYKSAIGGHREGLQQWNFQEIKPRQFTLINGLFLRFHYTCHTVPTIGYEVRTSPELRNDNLVYYYSCDTLAEQGQLLDKFMAPDAREAGEETLLAVDADGDFVMDMVRLDEIMRPFRLLEETWDQVPPPMFCIEGGRVGIHTPFDNTFAWLKDFAKRKGVTYEDVMRRVRVYHMADSAIQGSDAAYKWQAGYQGFISFARQIARVQSQQDRIQNWIHQTPLLSEAGINLRRQLAAAAQIVEVPEGEELAEDFIYIPIAGAFAPNDKPGTVIQPFGVIGAAAVFDDASVVPAPSPAMRALVPSQVLRISLSAAREIFRNNPDKGEREALRTDWRSYVENVRIASGAVEQSRMSHLPQSILAPLFMAADQQHYADGATIVSEGQHDDREHQDIYLVINGDVRIQRRDGSLDIKSGRGTVFGEMAFVNNRPRSATVSAEGPVTVLCFSAQKMRHLMKRYPGIWIALSRLAAERRSVVH